MTPNQAATVALKGLAYIVNLEPERIRFAELSGADRDELRERADEPEFLVAVLDFMLANEAVVVDFCESTCMDARDVHRARHVLSGG